MPNRSAVLHPRAHAALDPQFYPDRMAIDDQTIVTDPESGEEHPVWVPRAGYQSIPAAMAPAVIGGVNPQEDQAETGIWSRFIWHVSMNGYYPAIETDDRLRREDGETFNIIAVEHDSRRQFTRLRVEQFE